MVQKFLEKYNLVKGGKKKQKRKNIFESNLSEITRGRYKSEKQKNDIKKYQITLAITRSCYQNINGYSSVVSGAKYRKTHGKGTQSMLVYVACVAKIYNLSNIKKLSPKQMLQRLPKALSQVKASNATKSLLNEIIEVLYSLYRAK